MLPISLRGGRPTRRRMPHVVPVAGPRPVLWLAEARIASPDAEKDRCLSLRLTAGHRVSEGQSAFLPGRRLHASPSAYERLRGKKPLPRRCSLGLHGDMGAPDLLFDSAADIARDFDAVGSWF